MSDRPVAPGDKLHIITRRLFDGDVRRHFAGEAAAVSDGLVAVRGYTFVFDPTLGEFQKRPKLRTRVFSLGQAGHIVKRLPNQVDVEALAYEAESGALRITDGRGFALNVHEFGPSR